MSKETLYSSVDFLVTRESGVVTLEQRNRGGVIIGVISLALALGCWWARGWFTPGSVYLQVLSFFCVIMGIAGAALLSGAFYFLFHKRECRFDAHNGVATLRGSTYAMRDIAVPHIQLANVRGSPVNSLVIKAEGRDILLMSSSAPEALEPVLVALRDIFAANTGAVPTTVGTAQVNGIWGKYWAVFLLVLGALWSAVGYLTMPDVILGSRRSAGGVLLWPLGLWLIALGLLEALLLWRGHSLFAARTGLRRLTLLALLISYLLVCYR